jgi:hypothetical protein
MAQPVNLINFTVQFRHVERWTGEELLDIYNSTGGSPDRFSVCQQFTNEVVEDVKRTIRTTQQKTCSIPNLRTRLIASFELVAVARHLYRCYGIEIRQVDNMASPRKIVVSWLHDHSALQLVSPFVKIDDPLADTTLKWGGKSYKVHRLILSVRSPKFLELLQQVPSGQAVTIERPGIEQGIFEEMLQYFYEKKVDLSRVEPKQGRQLLDLAAYFELPYLHQQWCDELCSRVTISSLKECLAFAEDNEELREALFSEAFRCLKLDGGLDSIDELSKLEEVLELATPEQLATIKPICTEILNDAFSDDYLDKILAIAEKFNFAEVKTAYENYLNTI